MGILLIHLSVLIFNKNKDGCETPVRILGQQDLGGKSWRSPIAVTSSLPFAGPSSATQANSLPVVYFVSNLPLSGDSSLPKNYYWKLGHRDNKETRYVSSIQW